MNYLFVSVDTFEFMTNRVNGGEMNTDYVLMYQHGLGYAHSVT